MILWEFHIMLPNPTLSFPLFQHLFIHPRGIRSFGVSGSLPFCLINPTCKCSLQWVLGLVQGLWSLAHHHHWILIKMPLLLMLQSWRFCSYHSTGLGKGHISSYNACVLHIHGGQWTCARVDTRGRHEVPHSVPCFLFFWGRVSWTWHSHFLIRLADSKFNQSFCFCFPQCWVYMPKDSPSLLLGC